MEDIRQIERQTQEALKRKMGMGDSESPDAGDELNRGFASTNGGTVGAVTTPQDSSMAKTLQATLGSIEKTEQEMPSPPVLKKSDIVPTIQTDGSGDGSPEDSPTEIILRWDGRLYGSQFTVCVCWKYFPNLDIQVTMNCDKFL